MIESRCKVMKFRRALNAKASEQEAAARKKVFRDARPYIRERFRDSQARISWFNQQR
jgi:hypothetical protein